MGVHLQRGFDVCMAQNFRKGFCIHSPFNAACGKGMAKHMIIPGRNVQGNLEPLKTVLQCSGFHWFTGPGQYIVLRFCTQRTKQRKHFCRQGQIPKGAFTFGRLKDQFRAPSVIDAVGRAPDMQQTAVKIYIRPTKGADLSQSDAGVQT